MRIKLKNNKGETIIGDLHKEVDDDCCIVLCHGFLSYRLVGLIDKLYHDLKSDGCSVCRFDFSGNGESEGSFYDSTYKKQPDDLKSVLDYLFISHKISRFVLAGHSMGGSAVLIQASRDERVKGVVLLAGVTKPYEIIKRIKNIRAGKKYRVPQVQGVNLPKRDYVITKKFLDDAAATKISIPSCPILCLHSPEDDRVPISYSYELPAKVIEIGKDHLLIDVHKIISKKIITFKKQVCNNK